MPKVTLDMNTFKALASDTRLDILRALDGKKLNLKDISKATNLNKATLHEHLAKLHEAGLVKRKERDGHKWVYYKLTWKGEGLLHPENTRIVVMFSATFIALAVGIINLINFVRGQIVGKAVLSADSIQLHEVKNYGSQLTKGGTDFAEVALASVDADTAADELSRTFAENTNIKNLLGDTISPENLDLNGADACETFVSGGTGTLGNVANAPQEMVLTFHDPVIQQIAIVCIIIFSILFCIGIWWLWKNRKPKL
jgi:DNA-binding transcriptional ArsR family regulator